MKMITSETEYIERIWLSVDVNKFPAYWVETFLCALV
jgi:hypothetical protein